MAKAGPKNTAPAFRSLEAELANLHRPHDYTTKKGAKKAEARIKKRQ